MAFGPRQLSIVVPPLPGEALDSWIEAYARRLLCTSASLLDFLGLTRARAGGMLISLAPEECDTLAQATGVDHALLTAMTLRPFDGLAVTIKPAPRGLAYPPAWRRTAGSRYCPSCLRGTGGRWQLAWRLPWSFACSRHGMLLVETCPSCNKRPVPFGTHRIGVTRAGTCTTPVAAEDSRRRSACGHSLTDVLAVPLPAEGLILAAQHYVDQFLRLGTSASTPAPRRSLKELFILAWRALTALQTNRSSAPQIAHQILHECGGTLPRPLTGLGAEDAHAVAVGTALAVIAHREGHPDGDRVLNWIVRADRTKRDTANLGGLLQPWRAAGPELMGRVLTAMDAQMLQGNRLRYASASPNPRLPAKTEAQIRGRATMVPATLWPSWSMRLFRNNTSAAVRSDSFRAALSAMLLLPGAKLTYSRAVELLGNRAAATATTIRTILQTFDEADRKPVLSTLAQLAAALDTHGSPINYARRRKLFAAPGPVVDRDAYKQLCARQGWRRGAEYRMWPLDRYLLALLTGTQLVFQSNAQNNWARDKANAAWNDLRYRMPIELREFLHAQALANLNAHGIEEPLQWEPPKHWVTGVIWRGADPDQVDQQLFRHHTVQGNGVAQMAAAMSLSTEHVRLYADISGITMPKQRERKQRPVRIALQGVLAPDQLRELYEQRHMSTREIAKLAGSSAHAVSDALRMAGIAIRPPHRQPNLPITHEWLEEEYITKKRPLGDIALELGISPSGMSHYAKRLDIKVRPRSYRYLPRLLARLELDERLSPEIEAAFTGRNAVERIRRIVCLPGQRSIRAAARALGAHRGTLSHQLEAVEEAVGFKIIERASPLSLTHRGDVFVQQAQDVLRLLDDPATWGHHTAARGQ